MVSNDCQVMHLRFLAEGQDLMETNLLEAIRDLVFFWEILCMITIQFTLLICYARVQDSEMETQHRRSRVKLFQVACGMVGDGDMRSRLPCSEEDMSFAWYSSITKIRTQEVDMMMLVDA